MAEARAVRCAVDERQRASSLVRSHGGVLRSAAVDEHEFPSQSGRNRAPSERFQRQHETRSVVPGAEDDGDVHGQFGVIGLAVMPLTCIAK